MKKITPKDYIEALQRMDTDVLIAASFLKNSGDDYFSFKEVYDAWDALMEALHVEQDCSGAWQILSKLKEDEKDEEIEE